MKICKTCGRPEGELRDDDEPRESDEYVCWLHVNPRADCSPPRDDWSDGVRDALERLDEVTRERDAAIERAEEAERLVEAARRVLSVVAESMTEHAYQELAAALEHPGRGVM